MTIFEWSALGAIMLAILIFCARLMRRGLTTLDDDRRQYLERIKLGERQLEEDRKKIPALEHLYMMRAALEDLLRLDGNPAGYAVRADGRALELSTPEGVWRVSLIMRERSLRSAPKTLRGKSRWLLSGFGFNEQHADPASLMRSLNSHIHGGDEEFTNLPRLDRNGPESAQTGSGPEKAMDAGRESARLPGK